MSEPEKTSSMKFITAPAGSELYESMVDCLSQLTGAPKEKVIKELGDNPCIGVDTVGHPDDEPK